MIVFSPFSCSLKFEFVSIEVCCVFRMLTKVLPMYQILYHVKQLKNGWSILEKNYQLLLSNAALKNKDQIWGGSRQRLLNPATFYKPVSVLEQTLLSRC